MAGFNSTFSAGFDSTPRSVTTFCTTNGAFQHFALVSFDNTESCPVVPGECQDLGRWSAFEVQDFHAGNRFV